jgi:SDR family mycofactocin-dependent oxidoreductase
MGEFEGKIALVTGAARGQGRSHALRLAAEGADIIAVDICQNVSSMDYDLASEDDLNETVKMVEGLDRRIVARVADVRSRTQMKTVVDEAVAELGGLDVVCANAGICIMRPWHEVTEEIWDDQVDTNLKGVWNTLVATVPHLIERGGGSIVITASAAGVKAYPYLAPYVAAKHGLIGLAKEMANELALQKIRVNCVSPNGVNTKLLEGLGGFEALMALDPHSAPLFTNALALEMVEPDVISDAVLWLASDRSLATTGHNLHLDLGNLIR